MKRAIKLCYHKQYAKKKLHFFSVCTLFPNWNKPWQSNKILVSNYKSNNLFYNWHHTLTVSFCFICWLFKNKFYENKRQKKTVLRPHSQQWFTVPEYADCMGGFPLWQATQSKWNAWKWCDCIMSRLLIFINYDSTQKNHSYSQFKKIKHRESIVSNEILEK